MADRTLDTPVIWHNGATSGYRSLVFWLPEHDLGAVVLTNGEQGGALGLLMQRRLLELVFQGSPRAEAQLAELKAAARGETEALAKGLTLPADGRLAARLATRYHSPDLGTLTVRRVGGQTQFDIGWAVSPVGTRVDSDGRVVVVTTAPELQGVEFEMAGADGRTLEVREHQQVYRYEAVQNEPQ